MNYLHNNKKGGNMFNFQTLIKKRRSVYSLGTHVETTQDDITQMIQNCLKNAPSAFNSQSTRIIVLYGESYQAFWHMVEQTLQKIVPADKFEATKQRIVSFASGIGTVLFFEDDAVIQSLKERMPTYADRFVIWAEHANAMVQYMVWDALAEKNIGASLQHYNPLIDEQVHRMFDTPKTWRLIAQMPFGSIEQEPNDKFFEPIDKRFKVFR
jgi:predicted oxidoreductase (fatty acid repression mutant protein)